MPHIVTLHAKRNTQFDVCFPLPALSGGNFISAWTPLLGEIKVAVGASSPVNTANLPSYVGNKVWSLRLTAAEMDAELITVILSQLLTFQDTALVIDTRLLSAIPSGDPPTWAQVAKGTDIDKFVRRKRDPRNGR